MVGRSLFDDNGSEVSIRSQVTTECSPALNECATCGQETTQNRLCGRCRRVRYCSKECQVAHWKYHRSECKTADTAGQSILGDVKGQLDRGELVSYDHLPCYDAIGKLRDDLTSFSKSTSTAPYISSDNARKLLFFSEQVQFQHEQLEEEIDHVLKSLHQTFETFHIPIPKRNQPRYKRLAQLKSKENLQSLLTRCQSQKIEEQLESIKECRKLLSDQNPPIRELVEMGMVPIFVGFLKDDKNVKLQFEAAWILTNICSGTSEQTQEVINCGAVPQLIRLVNAPDEELGEQCVWALGNIAADSPSYRDILLEEKIVDALIPAMDSRRLTMLKNISWTMSNLCNGVQSNYWGRILEALPKFSRLIYFNDEEILKDVCWSLSCISSGTRDRIQALVQLDPNLCKRLVDLLLNHSSSVQHAALITVGNIVTGDDEQTAILINYGLLPRLRRLLSHTKKNILKDTCFTISNIAAGSQSQVSAIIESKVVPALILLFNTSREVDIKAEVTWALANALSNGTEDQISYLINQGCVMCLCEQLEHYDIITVEAVIESLENILRAGEGEKRPNRFASHLREVAHGPLSRIKISDVDLNSKIQDLGNYLK